MKKTLSYSVMALALVVGLILPLTTPVTAEDGAATSLVPLLTVDPPSTDSDGTLYYTLSLANYNVPGAHDVTVDVTFYPPGPTGAQGAYGSPVTLDTDKLIVVGQTVVYNWNGSMGALARPALAVDLGAIPLNQGVTVAYANSEFDGDYIAEPPYDAYGTYKVPATVTWSEPPVGGEAFPIGKLPMLAPWIALGAAIAAGATIFVRRRHVQS